MVEKLVYQNPNCTGEKHEDHLCFLMHEGFHYSHKAEYKAIVKDAEFRCENCARTAQLAKRLCAPMPL
jgi:hypothetical protein